MTSLLSALSAGAHVTDELLLCSRRQLQAEAVSCCSVLRLAAVGAAGSPTTNASISASVTNDTRLPAVGLPVELLAAEPLLLVVVAEPLWLLVVEPL